MEITSRENFRKWNNENKRDYELYFTNYFSLFYSSYLAENAAGSIKNFVFIPTSIELAERIIRQQFRTTDPSYRFDLSLNMHEVKRVIGSS